MGTILVSLVVVALAASAHATTCTELCGSSTGACQITSLKTVTPGSDIDCSGRDVLVAGPNGRIVVTNGVLKMTAANLSLALGRFIEASQTTAGSAFGIELTLSGDLDAVGYLKADGNFGGGSIVVKAAGDVTIDGAGTFGVSAKATGVDTNGGEIRLESGGDIVVEDKLVATYNPNSGIGRGGRISLIAAGGVVVDNDIDVQGRNQRGGTVEIEARGPVEIQHRVAADGAGPDGDGGEVAVRAHRVIVGAAISAQGGVGHHGGQGRGGRIAIEGDAGGIALNADVAAFGGGGGGGRGEAIALRSEGDLIVAPGVSIRTSSRVNGGDGGDISLTAADDLTIGDAVDIDAGGDLATETDGNGGSISLDGCSVALPTTAVVRSAGFAGGSIEIIGRNALAVGATLDVTGVEEDGSVLLAYRGQVNLYGNAAGFTANLDTSLGACP